MKIRLQRPPMQDYKNRDYACHLLDDTTFDIINDGEYGPFLMMTGCLDALEQMPAGSMIATGGRYYDQSLFVRGVDAAEIDRRNEITKQLIDQMLAEGQFTTTHK